MTIRREKKEPPTHFPAARLYLEDIEEIVSIFRDAIKAQSGERPVDVEVVLRVGDQVCDEAADLAKLGKRTRELYIGVAAKKGGFASPALMLNRTDTQWVRAGISDESQWNVYNKLVSVFEKRRRRWINLANAFLRGWMSLIAWLVLILATWFTNSLHPYSLQVDAMGFLGFLGVIMLGAFLIGATRHSVVIFRNSWEEASLREGRRREIVVAAVGAIIGVLGTLFVTYIRHKFWP